MKSISFSNKTYRPLAVLFAFVFGCVGSWAQNRVAVTLESSSNVEYPERVIDGATGNDNYATANNQQATFIFDLGNVVPNNADIQVAISSLSARNQSGSVAVSRSDRTNGGWTTVYDGNLSFSNENVATLTFNPHGERYVRMVFTRSYSSNYAQRWDEIEFYSSRSFNLQHKQGKWYDASYQTLHPRTGTGMDDFDASGGMETTSYGHQMQKVHEYRATIYVNANSHKQIFVPAGQSNKYTVFTSYQRWYDYTTDAALAGDVGLTLSFNDIYAYHYDDGVFGGSLFSGDGTKEHTLYTVDLVTSPNFSSSYYVACDMSDYSDGSFDGLTFTEPTLGQRLIYEIRPASEIKNAIAEANAAGRYYENHDIHLPTTRISSNTDEQVALDMLANNYFVDGEDGLPGDLSVEITDSDGDRSTSTIYFSSESGRSSTSVIDGEDRKIPFKYAANITDGTVVYVNVYKNNGDGNRCNIAQFKLTFEANTEGLTETKLAEIENSPTDPLYFRTNANLSRYTLLNRLDFDFDNVSSDNVNTPENGISYYPYPLNWDTSSYGFYAGDGNAEMKYPQWGQYAITNGDGFYSNNPVDPDDARLPGSTFHLYVDANEKPGTICQIPFDADLCADSRLYVTAYIKSVNASNADAAVMFILKGINDIEGGGSEETVIYTHSSGQIQRIAASDHDWRQIYFQFVSPGEHYDRYVLELFNNCANTTGGDFCIDDIRVYFRPINVSAHTVRPLCTGDTEAEIEVSVNYEMLLDRAGLTDNVATDTRHTVYFSFVDSLVYRNYLEDVVQQGGSINSEAINAAMAASLIHGDGVYGGSLDNYGRFYFFTDYEANDGNNGNAKADQEATANGRTLTLRLGVSANRGGLTTLQPGKTYYVVFLIDANSAEVPGDEIDNYGTLYDMGDVCGLRGSFTVSGPLIVKVEGGVHTSATAVCVGQEPNVDVEMFYYNREGEEGPAVPNAVFDWYFGTLDEFNAVRTEPIGGDGGVTHTLEEALALFRTFYPKHTSVTGDVVHQQSEEEATTVLYQEDIDLIRQLNTDYSSSGLNPKLTLSASHDLSIRLMQEETFVVLVPIGTEPVTPPGYDESYTICWEPTQMVLYAQGTAPTLNVGDKDEDYSGADGYRVKVRIGKSQYDALGQSGLTVPVRDPKLRLEDGTEQSVTVTQIGGEGANNLYLVWTDDSRYDVSENEMLIGTVDDFTISPDASANRSRVVIHFTSSDFSPREGFRYYLQCQFTSNPMHTEECYGTLTIPFVIVPDYQVWTGTSSDNWNDDGNWRRAEPTDLNKKTGYMTNDDNGTSQGFVPLEVTKVVIPSTGAVQLYEAPTVAGGRILDVMRNKGTLDAPTEYVQYDLTVQEQDDNSYLADIYQTNLCDQIHFDYGGEMLHSELLTHNRAWTEVNVPTKQWTLVSTPLNGVYSGDWYTKTSGDETAEYFTDLEFVSPDNNRLKPLMTQRSWDGNAKVVSGSNNASAVVSNVTWSSTFNDVAVPYQPGMGFSIHANMGSSDDGNGVTFRMPKSDTSYEGFNDDPLARDGANFGKLATSDMAALAEEGTDYEVEITPSQDGNYIIIGNPFVSHLSAKAFFEANSNVLQGKYWTANDDYPKAGVADDNGNWQTTDGTDAALIPPYTAFYAQLNSKSTQPQTIKFNTSMAALGTTASGDTPSTNGLVISAVAENGKSSTLLSYKASAENGYVTTEDVQLLNESDSEVPMVYTVAGDIATSINRIKDAQQIPLGVFAADDDVTTLTFTDVAALMEPSLYDAEMNTDTPLTEGYTLTVNGASHGRYFIRAHGAGEGTTGITDVETGDGGVSVYSVAPRQVVVSSGAELLEVSVYSVGGAMLGHESVGGGRTAVTLDGIDSGVAVVRVVTAEGQTTRKLVVK